MLVNKTDVPVDQVKYKHISEKFIAQLDEAYGCAIKENGGYVVFTLRFEGKAEPRWWEKALRFLKRDGE